MSLLPAQTRLVVASHNDGKVAEIEALLAPLQLRAVSAAALQLAEPEETGQTFSDNAILKAEAAAAASGLPALSDDSGLALDGLDGEPGIYSARWAGVDKDFTLAMRKVEEALNARGANTQTGRRAHFICALCLAIPGGKTRVFEGRVSGSWVWPPRGENGFGYDPAFLPEGKTETFGEMAPEAKHAMSHRARAFEQLLAALRLNAGDSEGSKG